MLFDRRSCRSMRATKRLFSASSEGGTGVVCRGGASGAGSDLFALAAARSGFPKSAERSGKAGAAGAEPLSGEEFAEFPPSAAADGKKALLRKLNNPKLSISKKSFNFTIFT